MRAAGREAMDAFDVLLVCGFSFAPEVDETLIQQGFQEAAKKSGKTAPSDVSQYIDSTLYTQPS